MYDPVASELRWQTERDANIIKEFSDLKNDPARLSRARQKLIAESQTIKQAIGKEVPRNSRHGNAATIKKL